MAELPDILAPCGCRIVTEGEELAIVECEPYRSRLDAICPNAAMMLDAARKAGLETDVVIDDA